MIILNDGCSFSRDRSPTVDAVGRLSYCMFLPDIIHNIAHSGSGIESTRLTGWLRRNNKTIAVTHFIYQIPSPSRQILWSEFNDEHFFKAPFYEKFLLYWNWLIPLRALLENGVILPNGKPYNNKQIKDLCIARNTNVHELLVKSFEHKERYLIKALIETEKIVNIIRKAYSDIKIIFLRYEESSRPLIYEFCNDFYKNMLPDYCKDNDITYIYEENFHTKWFNANGFCADNRHSNKAGAKLIADKIKEYL